jgi:hypothetical protein
VSLFEAAEVGVITKSQSDKSGKSVYNNASKAECVSYPEASFYTMSSPPGVKFATQEKKWRTFTLLLTHTKGRAEDLQQTSL